LIDGRAKTVSLSNFPILENRLLYL
jgi:hypothetical protein